MHTDRIASKARSGSRRWRRSVPHTTTSKGFVTTMSRDATGRDSVVKSPIDSLQTQFRTQIHLYDANDRLTSSVDSALAGSIPQTVRVVNGYDNEGHLKNVSRTTTPDWRARSGCRLSP